MILLAQSTSRHHNTRRSLWVSSLMYGPNHLKKREFPLVRQSHISTAKNSIGIIEKFSLMLMTRLYWHMAYHQILFPHLLIFHKDCRKISSDSLSLKIEYQKFANNSFEYHLTNEFGIKKIKDT